MVEQARLLMTIDNHSSLHGVAATGTAVAETEPQDGMFQLKDQIKTLTQQVAALATLIQGIVLHWCGALTAMAWATCSGTVQVFQPKVDLYDLDMVVLSVGNLNTFRRSAPVRETGRGHLDWVPDALAIKYRPTFFFSYHSYNEDRCSDT